LRGFFHVELMTSTRSLSSAAKASTKRTPIAPATTPDPHTDLYGWAQATLQAMRTQTLRSLLRLREEAEEDKASAGGSTGDEVDLSAAREAKQSRIQILATLQDQLSEIDAALRRLEAGDYGICEETGDDIPVERLIANPLSRTTVEAQQRREHLRKLFAGNGYRS
jgi:DnaK suppressor protein